MSDQGFQTFGDIVSQVTRFAKDTSTSFTNITKDELNRAYRSAADATDWVELRKILTNVTSTAGSANIYLPSFVESVRAVFNQSQYTNLDFERLESLVWKNPLEFNSQGMAYRFADSGQSCVLTDFSSTAETIVTVSSSTADATSITVRLHGINSNNVEITELVTLNGTTAVTSTNTYSDLYSVSTDDTHTGIITYSGTTSLKTYGRIAASDKTAFYKKLRLSSPAVAADTFVVVYKKAPRKLTNDEDVPEIPVSTYLREMGLAFALQYDENEAAAQTHIQAAQAALSMAMDRSKLGSDDAIQSQPALRPKLRGRLEIFRTGG